MRSKKESNNSHKLCKSLVSKSNLLFPRESKNEESEPQKQFRISGDCDHNFLLLCITHSYAFLYLLEGNLPTVFYQQLNTNAISIKF